jgi:hypothetical protein
MALLPLLPLAAAGQSGVMNKTASRWTGGLGRLARKVGAAIAECNDASRLMTELNTSPDHYVFRPRTVPDTYAEFLYRTSGPLAHEPSARARAESRARR